MADDFPPLSLPAIAAALGHAACRFDVDLLRECASTNAELLLRAAKGAPAGTVVVAERQTAGRGRMGREWIAAPGDSLTFSLLWRFPADTGLSGLSLAVGVGVARALEKVGRPLAAEGAPRSGGDAAAIRLKWPNDVLQGGRKLAGILIELQSSTAAVIGIGLNLRLPAAMPAELRASAAALGTDIDPSRLLAALLAEQLAVLDEFSGGGFPALRDEWLARHAWCGQPVRVQAAHAEAIEGSCAGVDADGALLLDTAGGRRRILAGDVSLRLAQSA
jgi:BirA family biotin operon repressor/biotin-[acetyl-CoA-carboxylase] ligase